MNEIIINVICCILAVVVFVAGVFVGIYLATAPFDDEDSECLNVYCFQCEIGMPAILKKGHWHCKNCGLRHGGF